METKYYGGVLFMNDRKDNERAPDLRGEIEISPDMLKSLVEKFKAQEPLKMELAGWMKQSAKGTKFYSLKASEPRQQMQQRSQAPRDRDIMDDAKPKQGAKPKQEQRRDSFDDDPPF